MFFDVLKPNHKYDKFTDLGEIFDNYNSTFQDRNVVPRKLKKMVQLENT